MSLLPPQEGKEAVGSGVLPGDKEAPVEPVLEGVRVRIRPINPGDYTPLYDLTFADEGGWRWVHRGESRRFEDFIDGLWRNALVQHVIEDKESGRLVGFVRAYSYQARDGHAHFAVLFHPEYRGLTWPWEGALLFLDYVFCVYPVRKLYMESLGFNFQQFASGLGKWFVEEGRLRDHEYHGGRYWDLHLLAMYREDFEKRAPVLKRVFARGAVE